MTENQRRTPANIPPWYRRGTTPVYYVRGVTDNGKVLFEGPKFNLEEARSESLKLFGNDFEIFTLFTTDFNKAKSQVRSKLWHKSANASESFQPMYRNK